MTDTEPTLRRMPLDVVAEPDPQPAPSDDEEEDER